MARIMCNFFSYSLGHGVDIEVTLPSFTSCNMEGERSHKLPGRFPVLYLLHGHGNDYAVWHRYTSVDRYAEEKRIAIVTFSVGNKPYSNEPGGDNFYDFLEQELPDFPAIQKIAILRDCPWEAMERCCTAWRTQKDTGRLALFPRRYLAKSSWKKTPGAYG